MDSFTEQGRDGFHAVGANYMSYAFSAQQELFQLGMNLFQRELETGRKMAACRDMSQAFAVFNHLMQETAEDFSAATARLLERASTVGSRSLQDAEHPLRAAGETAQRSAEAAARTMSETAERTEWAAAASSHPRRRARK
ncbi:MAG: hypothetical protein ACREFL_01905 [Stellaceae bacterium]